ncbi:MAG: N-6 DNA methylase [Cyanobacteria bacterium P01_F01_bin.53]
MNPKQIKQEFLSLLKSMEHSRSLHRAFSDWLEIAAISFHQLPYHSQDLPKDEAFHVLESQYLERIKPYTPEELTMFAKLMGLISMVHHGHFSDFLGEVAGECRLLNKHGGQFFTPYHLCKAIAKMTFFDVRSLVEEKGLITVNEPACGAGALVIAGAEEIHHQGIDPRSCAQFDCTDVSRDAFNMAYIQLSALGLQAVVRHGNTLSMEMWESRPTPQLRLFNQWLESHQRTHQMVQAMRSLLASQELAQSIAPVEPDVVLNRQLSLF